MSKLDKLILMGVISGAHGIKGDLIIKSFMENTQEINNLKILDRDLNEIAIKYVRNGTNGTTICRIVGCNSRNQAESLIKTELYCLRTDMTEPKDEEFYFEDLVGLKVLDLNNREIATITGVFNYGAGDIIEMELIANNKKIMLPFTKEYFPTINHDHIVCNEKL